MLELLVELLAQPAQLLRVTQILGIDLFVVGAAVGAVRLVVVGDRLLAALLRAAGPVLAFGGRRVVVGLVLAFLLGAVGLHLLRLRPEHRLRVALLVALLLLLVVLGAAFLAALVLLVLVRLRLALDLGFGQVERGQ